MLRGGDASQIVRRTFGSSRAYGARLGHHQRIMFPGGLGYRGIGSDEEASAVASGVAIETMDDPLAAFAGIFPDDEVTREWREAIAEYRRKVDADDRCP